MSKEKRFECVFVEEGFGGTYRRLRDNETGIVHMTCDVADLLNFQNTQIKCLKEENEQLQKELNNFKPVMFQDMRKGTIILYSKGDIDE